MALLLFDLDGTLLDTAPGIVAGMRHTLEQLGRPIPSTATLQSMIGPPLEVGFSQLLGEPAGPEVSRAVEIYRQHYAHTGQFQASVFEGILPALKQLSDYQLGVATSKRQVFAEQMLEHYGLSGYFTAIYGVQPSDLSEPKSSLIGRAMRDMTANPARTIMIGDRIFDLEGARANQVPAIGALWGYGSSQELAGAQCLCATPQELPAAIQQLLQPNTP